MDKGNRTLIAVRVEDGKPRLRKTVAIKPDFTMSDHARFFCNFVREEMGIKDQKTKKNG